MDYRAAIIDDRNADAEYVESILKDWMKKRQLNIWIERFCSAESFLFQYEDHKDWDILLLDIEMKGMDGVALAKLIREENKRAQIIFITGFPDFMSEGYEVSALHYLMKPVVKDKLFTVLDRAVEQFGRQEKQLVITFDRQTVLVPVHKITYLEAQKQYVVIHTEDQSYRMRVSLGETAEELDEYFLKCQRSFIVNLRYVQQINHNAVILKDGTEVPISRGMAQKIGKEIIRLF